MLAVTDRAAPLPTAQPLDRVQQGCVFLDDNGQYFAEDDQKVVVERDGADPLELRTRSTLGGARQHPPGQRATFLSRSDFDKIDRGSGPITVRTYRPIRDALRKLRSGAGALTLAPVFLAAVTAGLAMAAAWMGKSDSDVDSYQSLLAWVTQPVAGIPTRATSAPGDQLEEVRNRLIVAQWCQSSLVGHRVSTPPSPVLIQPLLNQQTVAAGNTLWSMAQDNYGGDAPTQMLVEQVAAANHIGDPNVILVGQTIHYPPVRATLVAPVNCTAGKSWLKRWGFAFFGGTAALLTAAVSLVVTFRRCGFRQSL
jgi:LysM repeat protein